MKGSLKLFNVFGISIRLHFTFFLLPFFVFFSYSAHYGGYIYGLRGIFLIIFVFCCVTLHELCHSLLAKRFGVKVEQIVLLPIGGVAGMSSIPEDPSQEFKISLAGPLFNIVFALVLFFPLRLLLGAENFFHPGVESWPKTIAFIFWINPVLAFFNLLPAFPMDGGRILRAFLARRMDYAKATRIAVGFGHVFAVFFGFLGMVVFSNVFLIIIAFFIFMAASSEGMQVELRTTLGKFLVKDVLPAQFFSIVGSTPLRDVLGLTMRSHQEDFPVIEDDKLVGMLTRADIILTIHQFGMEKLVRDVMRKKFPTIQLHSPLIKAQRLMQEWQVKAIPVVKNGQVVGVVSVEDISRVYLLMSGKR